MRYRTRRPQAPGSAIEEGRQQAGLGELPAELRAERALRPPILTPRGNPTDNPFRQMPGVAAPPPAQRIFSPQGMSTYVIEVPAGSAVQIYGQSRERSYSLVVNGGANDAVITYGRFPSGAGDGIPLAAAGVGFHELVYGTTSTLAAFSASGTFLIVTEGRYDPAMEQ